MSLLMRGVRWLNSARIRSSPMRIFLATLILCRARALFLSESRTCFSGFFIIAMLMITESNAHSGRNAGANGNLRAVMIVW